MKYTNELVTYSNNYAALESAEKNIKELEINKNTIIINEEAFKNSELEKVHFSPNLETIRDKAFMNTKISEVTINSEVSLGISVFSYINNLSSVDIKCKFLPNWTFFKSTNENGTDFSLSQTEEIDYQSFKKTVIKSLYIPKLKVIGENAFEGASFLFDTLILPNTLKEIKSCAFVFSSIKNIKLPENIESIGSLQNSDINLIMSKHVFNKLGLKKTENIILKDSTIDELLEENSFKELNKKVLNKEIFII